MEYTRRNKKRKRRRKERGEAGRALAALLMIAAIIYLVGASATGNWAAENLIAPAMEAIQSLFNRDSNTEKDPQTEDLAVSLTQGQSAITVELTLPAVYCCALQMGVYSDVANAEKQATSLQSAGAGGYILEDNGRYRVLAAGYATQAEAVEVKERLQGEGMDCTIYTLQADSATYRVSVESAQLAGVEAGFNAIYVAQQALTQAAIVFDRDGQTVEDGKAVSTQILAELNEGFSLLTAYSGSNAMLNALLRCYVNCADALSILTNSNSSTMAAFSASLKHTQLYVTDQYASLMQSLG